MRDPTPPTPSSAAPRPRPRRTPPPAIPPTVKRDGAGVRQPAARSIPNAPNAKTKNKLATDDSVVRSPAARGRHSTTNDTSRPSRIPKSRAQMKPNRPQKDKVGEMVDKRTKTSGPTPVNLRLKRTPPTKPAEPASKLGLKRSPKTLIPPPDTVKRTRAERSGQDTSEVQTSSAIPHDEKETAVSSQDVAVAKLPSKLPVPDKSRSDVPTTIVTTDNTTEMLTKVVGLETLYAVLSEEHLGLQMSAQEAWRVANCERARRRAAEAELQVLSQAPPDNPINLALAHQIQQLQETEQQLRQENSDLKEELELLEFRILEMDSSPKRAVSRSSDVRCDVTEIDDVSDSGVMSLPTSEDDPQDFTIESEKDRDVKSRLMEMCKLADNVSERICLQQAVALIRHYEGRIENLESTISAMCHEASMTRTLNNLRNESADATPADGKSSGGRIIATVLPFTDPGAPERKEGEERRRTQRESDCLQESGIFEDGEAAELVSTATQTEPESPGDLTQEIRKLTQIRERIEEQGTNKKLVLSPPPAAGDYTPSLKEVVFYRERLEALESRLSVYESSGDAQLKRLSARLQKETILSAQVRQLNEKVRKLEEENRALEEERCELEEAENDTRLRCQKLELKLSALGEKKSSLKVQLQQASRVISSLRSSMAEEEKKQNEARQQANRLEALVHSYEQKNFELEEREMEVKYRLQMLENTMPALMMWNMWRMMCAMQGGSSHMGAPPPAVTQQPIPPRPPSDKEEELLIKLKAVETKLANENRLLEESRRAEESLRNKVKELERMVNSRDDEIIEILDRDPEEDVAVFEKLGKMAKDRLEMDKRIKDLEMKERLYQETLQQADTMFAEMEGGYAKQIQEKDEELEEKVAELSEKEAELSVKEAELLEKEAELVESQTKLRKVSVFSEISSHLQEKIEALEAEVTRLKETLSKREREREMLEQEEERLQKELQDCVEQLDAIKQNIEGPLKGELEAEKRRSKSLEESLESAEEELAKKEEERVSEVSKLKWQISRLTRDMMENEVTISELREEVQTLEATVGELRVTLVAEKEGKEELRKMMESELEKKDKVIDEMRESLTDEPRRKSLKEELEEIPDAQMIEQEILSAKGEYRMTSVEELIGDQEVGGSLEPILEEDEELVDERPQVVSQVFHADLHSDTLRTRSARQLQAAIRDIEELTESQVDADAILEVPFGGMAFKLGIVRSTECQIAQNAVAGVSGRDLKGTVSNLSKAYYHSKTCKECGETLGAFLDELIQQLGVKLPRVKMLGSPLQ